jgi:3-hydroxyisobutyrate dehydrogenase-like beta-hydroxyacid dehydrogenase
MNIGTIGLGAMGRPMSVNLAANGDRVLGYDIDPEAGRAIASECLAIVDSVSAVAADCELIVTMVPDDDALRKVVFGPEGILPASGFNGCLVDLSTTSVDVAIEIGAAMAQRGGTFLDAAVIGGSVEAARLGHSPIVVGGEEAVLKRYQPVLDRLGDWNHVGKLGTGKALKLLNNMLVGIFTASNAEALSLGLNAGLELPTMVEHLGGGSGSSVVLKSYMGRYIKEGIYGSGLIGHNLIIKDLRLACELADATDTPAMLLESARQTYAACAMTQGREKQFPSVFDHYRDLAGHEVPPAGAGGDA